MKKSIPQVLEQQSKLVAKLQAKTGHPGSAILKAAVELVRIGLEPSVLSALEYLDAGTAKGELVVQCVKIAQGMAAAGYVVPTSPDYYRALPIAELEAMVTQYGPHYLSYGTGKMYRRTG